MMCGRCFGRNGLLDSMYFEVAVHDQVWRKTTYTKSNQIQIWLNISKEKSRLRK